MYVCSVCRDPLPYVRLCDQVHAGVCHNCWQTNLAGNPREAEAHPAPLETVPPLTAYAQRVLEAGPAVRFAWLEEDAT